MNALFVGFRSDLLILMDSTLQNSLVNIYKNKHGTSSIPFAFHLPSLKKKHSWFLLSTLMISDLSFWPY